MRKKTKETPVHFPTTPEEFDHLVNLLMKKYKLESRAHTEAVVINRTQHAPVDQIETTVEYLGRCVLKNKAYQLASALGQKAQHIAQMDQLITMLKSDPHNQEARDHLEKAIGGGSLYAKEQLEKFDNGPDYINVVSMKTDEKSMPTAPGCA